MKQWYSATELAGMPGMPKHARGVNLRAAREAWQRRKKQKGKGWEYSAQSLPAETRNHLTKQQATSYINTLADDPNFQAGQELAHEELTRIEAEKNDHSISKKEGLKQFAALPSNSAKKQRAKAREWVINAFRQYHQTAGGSVRQARHDFCCAINSGDIEVPAKYQSYIPKYNGLRNLTEASIQRWSDRYRKGGIWALTDNYGQSKGRSKIDTHPDLRRIVLGCLFKYPHITPGKIKAYIQADRPDLDIVSTKGIERYLKTFKSDNAQLWHFVTHPDKWKNVYMVSHGSHFDDIERLNQLWELDSTPGDWMLADGRHSVIGVIDRYSRRTKFYVSKTSKATAVCQLVRRAILDWGVPEGALTDNGKDYVSELLDSVLRNLDIEHLVAIPFASEEKGTIERTFRTMSHGILDLLPGFVGHNVAERKVIEARKSFAQRVMTSGEAVEIELTSDELQAKLDQWAEHVYQHNPHSGLDGQTPWQVANAWRGPVRTIDDERALDMLLLEIAGERVVGKKGVQYQGYDYIHPALGEHVGKRAHLKQDEQDLGHLAVYIDGEFICWATAPALTGIDRAEWAVVAKKEQKRYMSQQAEEYKQFKRDLSADVPGAILRHRIEQSDKVTSFPRQGTPHSTPAMEQARIAADARDGSATNKSSSVDDTELQALQQEMQQAPAPVIETDDPRRRYERWVRIGMRIEAGLPVDAEERRKYENYIKGDEYRSMKSFYEDFNLEIDLEA